MLHLKALQKTAFDHSLIKKKLLALRAATTEVNWSRCRKLGEITRRFHQAKDVNYNFRVGQSGKATEADIWLPLDLVTFANNRFHVKG